MLLVLVNVGVYLGSVCGLKTVSWLCLRYLSGFSCCWWLGSVGGWVGWSGYGRDWDAKHVDGHGNK